MEGGQTDGAGVARPGPLQEAAGRGGQQETGAHVEGHSQSRLGRPDCKERDGDIVIHCFLLDEIHKK